MRIAALVMRIIHREPQGFRQQVVEIPMSLPVFDTSESVNRLLRSVISALPPDRTRAATGRARHD